MYVDWEDRKCALNAMQEMYPHMKPFLIEICYDLYKQSLTDEDLRKKIEEVEKEPINLPSIHDFPEVEYKTKDAVKILKKGEFPEWECAYCKRGDQTFRSEEEPDFCQGCVDLLKKDKEKQKENLIEDYNENETPHNSS